MQSVHQFLRGFLQRLARSSANLTIADIAPYLCAALDVREVRILDAGGDELPRDMSVRDLIAEDFEVVLQDCIHPRIPAAHLTEAGTDGNGGRSRFQPSEPLPPMDESKRLEFFIREFNRLQARNDFMWAGYVVREMLPRLGYALEDTKDVLNRLRADRIVNVKKVPNPRNPDFPATGVQLNLGHPTVRAVLGLPEGAAESEAMMAQATELHEAD